MHWSMRDMLHAIKVIRLGLKKRLSNEDAAVCLVDKLEKVAGTWEDKRGGGWGTLDNLKEFRAELKVTHYSDMAARLHGTAYSEKPRRVKC